MADQSRSSHVGFSRILGPSAATALGFSVSFGLVLSAGAGVVLGIDASGTQLALILAGILYLPVLLTYLEMAAGRPGSASAYQISRGYGSTSLTFFVGWLMLAGLAAAASLLCSELAIRIDIAVQSIFGVDLDHGWFLIAAIVLGGMNEWLISEDRWRSRTVMVWTGLGVFVVALVWAALANPAGGGEIPRIKIRAHDLATIGLLAVGLWFVDLLLNHRRQMQRPDATLRWSLIGVWFSTIALGVVAAHLVLRSPSLMVQLWTTQISWGEARLEFLLLVAGLLLMWLGLSRLVSRTVRLTGAMALHGFLPTYGTGSRRRLRALISLLIFGTVVILAARWVTEAQLVAASAASFLLVTVLVTFPHARRPARELPAHRRNRLPLHPLFPGLTIAICAFLALTLPRMGQGIVAGWLLLGLVFYIAYAGRRARSILEEEVVVGEIEEVRGKEAPRILLGAGNRQQLASLLDTGSALARALDAEIVVLRILPTADELSMYMLQRAAEREWEDLDEWIGAYEARGVSILSLVRIAPSVEAGILAAANEYDVDLLLLGAQDLPREAAPSAVLSRVFSSTSRPLVVLRGRIETERVDVVVATGGGPHAPMALRVGAAIAENTGGGVELVSVVPLAQSEESAREALRITVEKAELDTEIQSRLIEAKSIESGLIEAAQGKLLVLGSSVDRLLERTVFEGLPMEIGRVREGATLTVKRAEAAMRFWQRRIWAFLARFTPTLTVSERSQVYSQMRHSARADTDFYALISLSSAIAAFGLLLDSGAVIIGAMLVAPLMSPILAMAQGVVQGNLLMIQRAGASTFKGMSVSIGVATVITAVLPEILPTGEILARTSPNLLDLGVALAAGAAAAWAVSRASVAAALPGVAIAVALVPPLCVVGYGLGTSQFSIAGGAFLLFLTNLAAIILTGAVIFVLLGFRPTRVEREAQVRRAAVVTLVTVAILIVPLGLSTVRLSRKTQIESAIEEVVKTQSEESFRIRNFSVVREQNGFLVEGTVYTFSGFETERLFAFQEDLERAARVPVRVQVTLVPATLAVAGEPLTDEPIAEESVVASEPE